MRLRSALFSVIVCVFLCGPVVLLAIQETGINVPAWLTSDSAKYLAGGVSSAQIRPYLSLEGFASKSLQSSIEDKLGNSIPMKASALLSNAERQRWAIAGADEFSKWSCIPTYWGSPIAYSRNGDFLCQIPSQRATNAEARTRKFAVALSDVVKRFPEKLFVVIVADESSSSEANPTVALSSGVHTTADVIAIFREECSDLSNFFVPNTYYQTPDEYYRYFYTTDHHWNGWGAIDAYVESLNALDSGVAASLRAPLQRLLPLKGLEWLKEHGSACRNGLMIVDESVNEPKLPLSAVSLERGSAPLVACDDGVASMRKAGPIASYDFYQTWYGQWNDTVVLNELAVFSEDSALVVCDSFGTAFKWVASTGFGRVSTLYDLHDSRAEAANLSETLSESDADIVFLVARPMSYQGVLDRFPEYLN